jgi:hypothetical protein
VNLLNGKIDIIKKNTQALTDSSKEVDLEVNTEKTKYMLLHIGYWGESQKVRYHWEDLDVGGWTILKWILER